MESKILIEKAKKLVEYYGVYAFKSDFEDEGSTYDETAFLRELSLNVNAKLNIKIGGAEAVTDMLMARKLCADGIVAPMIESPFAVKKYKTALTRVFGDRKILRLINVESVTAEFNLDGILNEAVGGIDGVVIGRVDFTSSINFDRGEINTDVVTRRVKAMLEKVQNAKLMSAFGGGIYRNAVSEIEKLWDTCDFFETRKTIFDKNKLSNIDIMKAIYYSVDFEIAFMKYRQEKFESSRYDAKRLEMIEKEYNSFVEDK
ncbi:MAG: aldolase/citrate lyase family protein [Clostridia bacterium]